MIPFASQRGGGQDLATHLMNTHDNEVMELAHVRGAISGDLHGAFKEWEVQARTLTRCQRYLYSLSVNPDPAQGELTREQYMDYIGRVEQAMGLDHQPRAIVFHSKYGREHCHVVWSRVDADNHRAVQLSHDRMKLMEVTRAFARDHHLDLPEGYDKSRQVGQVSLYEKEQERQTGLKAADHVQIVTEVWRHSDDAKSFVQALASRGYILATGKRPYVLIDEYGGMHALAKLIGDKSVRTDDLRRFLSRDFPVESLPSVDEARALVAADRKKREVVNAQRRNEPAFAALKHAQDLRRADAVAHRDKLREVHANTRAALGAHQRDKRAELRHRHLQQAKHRRQVRGENRPTGLAAWLGKVSGIAAIQRIRTRRAEAREMTMYQNTRNALIQQQQSDAKAASLRMDLQARAAERQIKSLERVDKREMKALERDLKCLERVRERGVNGMSSLEHLNAVRALTQKHIDATRDFTAAVLPVDNALPTVSRDFARAASRASPNSGGSDDREPDHGRDMGRVH